MFLETYLEKIEEVEVKENMELNKKAQCTECTDEQNKRIQDTREMFSKLYDFIEENCKPGRETSLVFTKLEEAQFWAIKGISREEK